MSNPIFWVNKNTSIMPSAELSISYWVIWPWFHIQYQHGALYILDTGGYSYQTLDLEVSGSNPAGGRIQFLTVRHFSTQSLSLSPFYRLDVTRILFKGSKRAYLLRPSMLIITKTRLFKYIENFTSKNWKFSDKNLWYFSYFCSKHRLWVLVRTASARRF